MAWPPPQVQSRHSQGARTHRRRLEDSRATVSATTDDSTNATNRSTRAVTTLDEGGTQFRRRRRLVDAPNDGCGCRATAEAATRAESPPRTSARCWTRPSRRIRACWYCEAFRDRVRGARVAARREDLAHPGERGGSGNREGRRRMLGSPEREPTPEPTPEPPPSPRPSPRLSLRLSLRLSPRPSRLPSLRLSLRPSRLLSLRPSPRPSRLLSLRPSPRPSRPRAYARAHARPRPSPRPSRLPSYARAHA